MRTILIVCAIAICLAGCSILKTLPPPEDIQKELKRVEVNMELASELNRRLYMAGAFTKHKYEKNAEDILYYQDRIRILKKLFDAEVYEPVNKDIKEMKNFLKTLQ